MQVVYTFSYSHSFVLTRMFSAELRRAMLYETLDRHFTFVDVRMADICAELQKLINAQKFMDDDPLDNEKYKQSTYQRWNAQVSLIPQCTLFKTLGDDIFIIHEIVPTAVDSHMKESITRVHIVNLEGFKWVDDPTNVVPTCTCPANRNLKDCCAGIMLALQQRKEFAAWYSLVPSFLAKRELLSRRLRADLDPVCTFLCICHDYLF